MSEIENKGILSEESKKQEVPEVPAEVKSKAKKGKERKRKSSAFPWLLMLFVMLAAAGAFWQTRDYWIGYFTRPPWDAPYMITSSVYEGTDISEDGADFKASFAIDIASRDIWKKIPLVPSSVAIIDADLPTGAYLVLSDGMYMMITRKSGKVDVSVKFSVAVQEEGVFQKVKFERVPSVTCMFKATLPEEQLDVEVTGAQSTDFVVTNGTTAVAAALPDNVPIELTWKTALPALSEGVAKYYSETKTLISVAEGIVLGQASIDFSILHNPTHVLMLDVPTGVSVLDVSGKDLRDWRLDGGKMAVHLEKAAIGPYTLSVKYELSANMTDGKLKLPVITGAGEGEKGLIGVVALSNIEVKNGKLDKAHLIDSKDLPQEIMGMTTQPVLLAYRYAESGFDVTLDVNEPKDVDVLLSIIDRAHFTVMQTRDGKRITRAVYNVRNNRSQFLRIALPEGAELWSASVAGRVSQPVKDEQGRILMPLVRSQTRSLNASFPVEIVYAEEGTKPEGGRGVAKVEMPVCSSPIMNMMVSLYVPDAGRYDDFEGTLHSVKQFSVAQHAVALNNNAAANLRQVAQIQKVVPGQAGRSDLEVQLPLSGKVFRMEKILVIKDKQWFSYSYRNIDR